MLLCDGMRIIPREGRCRVRELSQLILRGLLRLPWLLPAVAIVMLAIAGQYGGAKWISIVAVGLAGGATMIATLALIAYPRPQLRTPSAKGESPETSRADTDANETAQRSRTDLRGAILTNARLARADLQDADLRGADLRGADLTGANLERALLGPRDDND